MEEGECRGEEGRVLVLAFLIPEHLDPGVSDLGSNKSRWRRVIGYTGGEEGGHHHIMMGGDEGVLLATDDTHVRVTQLV